MKVTSQDIRNLAEAYAFTYPHNIESLRLYCHGRRRLQKTSDV